MMRLGLTGGIGSGKTTVAEMLRSHGATIIDADAISRRLTASGGLAIAPIADAFGIDFIASNGALDRDRMREASYSNAMVRRRLESIIHPLVASELEREESAAVESGSLCIVFDIPLLVESGRWRSRVDRVLVVDCTAEVQMSRVLARSGLSREMVEKIMGSQATRSQRVHAADFVIFNATSSKPTLAVEVERLARCLGL